MKLYHNSLSAGEKGRFVKNISLLILTFCALSISRLFFILSLMKCWSIVFLMKESNTNTWQGSKTSLGNQWSHSVQTPSPYSGLRSCSINTLRSSCCCRPTKRGARTTPTPKGHIKESIYSRQRDGHVLRENQNFPISPKFMLCKIVAIFCDVLMSLVSECSNVYCCSNKYRNTFTADNINILLSFIAVWTSGSWCA